MKTVLAAAAALCLVPAAARACPCAEDKAHHAQAKESATAPARQDPVPEGQARVTIPISGMHCDHCVARVKSALAGVEGVKTVDASLESGEAVVFFEKGKVDAPKLVDAVNALGYKAGTPLPN